MNSIKLLTTYAKADGGTRYLAVLSDNSIWWYMPNSPWQTSTSEGLPDGVAITHIAVMVRPESGIFPRVTWSVVQTEKQSVDSGWLFLPVRVAVPHKRSASRVPAG